jgi:DNA-binding NarL/FixJ family response regulator
MSMPGVEQSGNAAGRARVLTVDDNGAFLGVLRQLVGATGHLSVAGEARSGEQAVAAAGELDPDIVLMDVWMPGLGGVRAAEQIKAARPATLVVLISTTHPDELPPGPSDRCADAVLWKSLLDPRVLDELWLRHRLGSSA